MTKTKVIILPTDGWRKELKKILERMKNGGPASTVIHLPPTQNGYGTFKKYINKETGWRWKARPLRNGRTSVTITRPAR